MTEQQDPYRATLWQQLPFKMTKWRAPLATAMFITATVLGAIHLAQLRQTDGARGLFTGICLFAMGFALMVTWDEEAAATGRKAALGIATFLIPFIIATWVFR